MYNDITCIILSGGKSSRMGQNKSLMEIAGVPAIERIVNLVKPVFPKLILSTNTSEEYAFLNLEMVEDIYTHLGPASGIHAGLMASKTEKNFVISCDMQLMNDETIRFIIDYPTDAKVVIAKADGFNQQLAGVYSKDCIAEIDLIAKEDLEAETRSSDQKKRGCKVFKLVTKMNGQIIDVIVEMPNYKDGTFFNMNKPHEYDEIVERLANKIK